MFGWQGVTVSPRAPTTVVLVLAALLVGLVLGRATAAPAPPTVEPIAIDRPAPDDRDSVDSGPDDEPAPSTTTTAIPPLTQATTTTAPPAPAAPEPVPTAPPPTSPAPVPAPAPDDDTPDDDGSGDLDDDGPDDG